MAHDTRSTVEPDDSTPESFQEDPFTVADVGGDAKVVLESLRTRLLDLTLVNRVLNFKPDGSRVVRVIDELPNQLFDRLRAGAELEILPVARPPARHALAEKTTSDGAPKKERREAAKKYAVELGFSTSYELPRSTGVTGTLDRHSDDAIQTLLFPNDLEVELRALHTEAKSAVEEKGSNILYLVFGLLKWFESDISDKPIYSPLVMLPVTLRRGDPDRKTGQYRFFITHTDEDVLFNISLQERLRRDFKIVLPELTDDEKPEQYFDRLEAEATLQPRWSVCREVALGLLSFTKLFMYRDLDPNAWPKGAGPAEHPLVLDLFRGGGTGDEYAREYDFEGGGSGKKPQVVPPIILDADSSQHSAIVDAMAGRTIVIEGPPGTGKSQTIANLIAAALGEGKSVLFVADKLTALKVVSHRLEKEGLGMFCLELHSDKTQKSRMMDDLRKRLDARGKLKPPLKLDERLQVLHSTRRSLNEYASVMNKQFGALGVSIHDILWGTQRRRSLLGVDADPWREVVFEKADQISHDRYEKLCVAAQTFSQLLAEVRPVGARLQNHPFYGVWPNDPRPDAEEVIIRALQHVATTGAAALESIRCASDHVGEQAPSNLLALHSWLACLQLLATHCTEGTIMGAARMLETPQARTALADWCEAVEQYRQRQADIDVRAPNASAKHALIASAPILAQLSPRAHLDQVVALPQSVASLVGQLDVGGRLTADFAGWLGDTSFPRTLDAIGLLSELISAVASTPLETLAFRTSTSDEAPVILDGAARRASELLNERAQLTEAFHLDLVPEDLTVLEQHAATCATAGFFSFFSGVYRAAKRQYAILAKQPGATDAQMAGGFKAIATHLKRVQAFLQDAELQRFLGSAFRGLDTNFEGIRLAREWQERIATIARRARPLSARLGEVARAPIDRLRDLLEMQPHLLALRDLVPRTRAVLDLQLAPPDPSKQDIESLTAALNAIATLAAPLSVVAREVALPGGVEVKVLSALIGEIASVDQLRVRVAAAMPTQILGTQFVFPNVPINVLRRTVDYASLIWSADTPPAIRNALLARPSPDEIAHLQGLLLTTKEKLLALSASEEAFVANGSVMRAHWYENEQPQPAKIVFDRANAALQQRNSLSPWLAFLRTRLAIWEVGGDRLREVVEQNPNVDITKLRIAAELVVYASLAKQIFDQHPALRGHEGFAHTNLRNKFREYDVEIMKLDRQQLACRIDANTIPEGVKGATVKNRTELALLNHELGKQRAHIPIRQLVNRAGGALRALKPCFMMSPRSVAQYLEAGRHHFDMVIMDEASQLRPEDAMGAIARAKQAVIVGDSKQLPPTSFFATGSSGEDGDEEFIIETKESILDLAKTAFKPVRQLRWHYRSRHGSLIAFSNDRYYDNNLIVFPSPADETDELGVKYVELKDATCVGGVNKAEAECVANAVLEHLRLHPKESFGVVAMNVKQKQLIEGLVSEKLKDQPELLKIFDAGVDGDPPFVKNLEAVQGDERDVIYISVTYGPTKPGGKVARTFGPLNGTSGWRRLNVLFTRAKKRVVLFSSFSAEALEGGGELSRGADDLKRYLSFARTGRYLPAEVTDREPDSDFEVEVAQALRDAGYPVVPQVGVAGYFIDLAVRHPQRRTEFVLGVECDGAAYHSSFSARDRDRLRQQVLEGLGWRIHRIWSTDWFRDPAGQRKRLIEKLKLIG